VNDLDARLFRLLYGGGGAGALAMVMLAFTALGSGWIGLLLVPLGAWPRTRRLAAALAVAIATQSILVFAIKRIAHRTRPWIALALSPNQEPSLGIGRELPHDFSFPSGHATASFTVAAFIAAIAAARGRHVVGASALAIAGLISVSRVFLGAHWPSDVLGGALLGTMIGVVAVRVARL
jgi:undecaprenyl-diphosphatase